MREEWPVARGRVLGHEAVGTIHELGQGIEGFQVGQRVLVPAITPCGSCFYCLKGQWAQCAGHDDRWVMGGGWRLGNSVDGCQAEYFRVPYAQANMAPIPDALSDRQVVLLADIASTGFSAAEKAGLGLGDTVAIFAQGPIGLCASMGARLKGAGLIIAVDSVPGRLEMARRLGADVALNFEAVDVVAEIRRLTQGRGVDVAIEALGSPATFSNGLKVLRPGGTLSSLGLYSHDLTIPPSDYVGGLGDQTIVNTLCPGGRQRMEALMRLVENRRIDLTPLLTHTFTMAQLPEAYDLFSQQLDGVLKVAVTP
jgi:threonine dehydrogenase-like Zn-dependent dehydrogenase